MSFDPVMNAVKDNPALLDELKAAKTPKERAQILDAHGIEKPHDGSELSSVAGGADAGGPGTDALVAAAAIG